MSEPGPEGMDGQSAYRYMASRIEALDYLRDEMARLAEAAPPFSETRAGIEKALALVNTVLNTVAPFEPGLGQSSTPAAVVTAEGWVDPHSLADLKAGRVLSTRLCRLDAPERGHHFVPLYTLASTRSVTET